VPLRGEPPSLPFARNGWRGGWSGHGNRIHRSEADTVLEQGVAGAYRCWVRFSCQLWIAQVKAANEIRRTYWLLKCHFFAIVPAMKTTIDSSGRIVVPKLHSDGASIALIHAGSSGRKVRGLILMAPHVMIENVCIESIATVRRTYRHARPNRVLIEEVAGLCLAGWSLWSGRRVQALGQPSSFSSRPGNSLVAFAQRAPADCRVSSRSWIPAILALPPAFHCKLKVNLPQSAREKGNQSDPPEHRSAEQCWRTATSERDFNSL
jgi:hypothetical protein